MRRFLAVVTNVSRYHQQPIATGLWLSELTHFLDILEPAFFRVDIASPQGGGTPIDPESLRALVLDRATRGHHENAAWMERLQNTLPLKKVSSAEYDGLYLTGGHGTMFDFVANATLQRLIAETFEAGKIVSAVCHGVCGLLDVKLSNGAFLVAGRRVTGYSELEERIARRHSLVPFILEKRLKNQGAIYNKALLPLRPFMVEDGRLITGQNPFSAKNVARSVLQHTTSIP